MLKIRLLAPVVFLASACDEDKEGPSTSCVVFGASYEDQPYLTSITVAETGHPETAYETLEGPLEPGGSNQNADPEALGLGAWTVTTTFENGDTESIDLTCDEEEDWALAVPYPFELDADHPAID